MNCRKCRSSTSLIRISYSKKSIMRINECPVCKQKQLHVGPLTINDHASFSLVKQHTI